MAIAGLPHEASEQLLQLLARCQSVDAVWLYGSRAMGRHHEGSDIDLCLEGTAISHSDRLQLMAAIDERLLPWQVDLTLKHELPPDLLAHLTRAGLCLWRRPQATTKRLPMVFTISQMIDRG